MTLEVNRDCGKFSTVQGTDLSVRVESALKSHGICCVSSSHLSGVNSEQYISCTLCTLRNTCPKIISSTKSGIRCVPMQTQRLERWHRQS
ncbi:hypothetical protein BGZ59_010422, partial [Podila verticillata]